ncbi:hypothetical protein BKA82DRAFT_4015417 [Pisolithus tinctorius]|nr:hypothetical protein BKA82DRAFT_4015417 [Pisolithus tinctorius]
MRLRVMGRVRQRLHGTQGAARSWGVGGVVRLLQRLMWIQRQHMLGSWNAQLSQLDWLMTWRRILVGRRSQFFCRELLLWDRVVQQETWVTSGATTNTILGRAREVVVMGASDIHGGKWGVRGGAAIHRWKQEGEDP